MSHEHKLSLPAAILINVNIILGSGIFINPGVLASRAGALGALSYAIIGLLMLPLIMSISELLKMHPSGGFYTFGQQEISPFFGFISAWSYFIGKLASATLMIHFSLRLLQQIIPLLSHIHIFALDISVFALFIVLNMQNLKTGSAIQALFMGFKMIPIFFAILGGLFVLSGSNFTPQNYIWSGIPSTLPFVLYAIIGFEAACSLSSRIKNAEKNAPLAIYLSYGLVILIVCLYQLIFYGVLGAELATYVDYREVFPALTKKLFPTAIALQHYLTSFLHIAIASSALGGGYSVFFSNSWNLYTLAQNTHIFGSRLFTQLNKHQIPWLCVIIEGIICSLYLLITNGDAITLQQLGVLGIVLSYTLCVVALLRAKTTNPLVTISWIIPILGFVNCALLTANGLYGLANHGINSLIMFILLMFFGSYMFWYTARQKN